MGHDMGSGLGGNDDEVSLAVSLMEIAGTFELQRKRERERHADEVAALEEQNRELQRQLWAAQKRAESLSRKFDQATVALEKSAGTQDTRVHSLTRELIAVRFDVADRVAEARRLRQELRRAEAGSSTSSSGGGAAAAADGDSDADNDDPATAESERAAELHSRDMLFLAAEEGLEEIVKGILEPTCGTVDTLGSTLGTALARAAGRGHVAIVKKLLGMGARADTHVETAADSEATAAAATGDGAASASGSSGSGAAADGADPQIVLLQTPLHAAALGGHEEVLRLLVATGEAVVDDLDAQERTPLHCAALANRGAVVKYLLLNGADPRARDFGGLTAAEIAEKRACADAQAVLADKNVLFWNCSVRANRHYNDKSYEGAIDAYTTALALAPDCSMATSKRDLATLHYNRARAAYRLGKHTVAVDDCTAALDHDSMYRNALAQRAECYMSLFDFQRAVRDFQALLDADPSDRQWARRLLDARAMRDMTHYQVLGLQVDATPEELKKSYRQQCLRWHPDKHKSSAEDQSRATTAFRRITEANEVLSDSYKRMVYDMEVRAKGAAGLPAEGFDRWYAREQERDSERAKERRKLQEAAEAKAQRAAAMRAAARERATAMRDQRQKALRRQQQDAKEAARAKATAAVAVAAAAAAAAAAAGAAVAAAEGGTGVAAGSSGGGAAMAAGTGTRTGIASAAADDIHDIDGDASSVSPPSGAEDVATKVAAATKARSDSQNRARDAVRAAEEHIRRMEASVREAQDGGDAGAGGDHGTGGASGSAAGTAAAEAPSGAGSGAGRSAWDDGRGVRIRLDFSDSHVGAASPVMPGPPTRGSSSGGHARGASGSVAGSGSGSVSPTPDTPLEQKQEPAAPTGASRGRGSTASQSQSLRGGHPDRLREIEAERVRLQERERELRRQVEMELAMERQAEAGLAPSGSSDGSSGRGHSGGGGVEPVASNGAPRHEARPDPRADGLDISGSLSDSDGPARDIAGGGGGGHARARRGRTDVAHGDVELDFSDDEGHDHGHVRVHGHRHGRDEARGSSGTWGSRGRGCTICGAMTHQALDCPTWEVLRSSDGDGDGDDVVSEP